MIAPLPDAVIHAFVDAALAEDVGRGDLTTGATVDPGVFATAALVFREPGVVCGLPVAAAVFRALDPASEVRADVPECGRIEAPGRVAAVRARAAAMLTGERLALNVVGRLSGIATLAHAFSERVAGTRAQVLDTRKTTPGLRVLEKYAVRAGGARNHRFALDDGILIKDNHLRLAGSIEEAIRRAKAAAPPGIRVEVEVETVEQLRVAIASGADMVLLDNMPVPLLREAVAMAGGRVPLEASGGVTLETVRAIAETGVDFVSAGALTHSVRSLDVALEVD